VKLDLDISDWEEPFFGFDFDLEANEETIKKGFLALKHAYEGAMNDLKKEGVVQKIKGDFDEALWLMGDASHILDSLAWKVAEEERWSHSLWILKERYPNWKLEIESIGLCPPKKIERRPYKGDRYELKLICGSGRWLSYMMWSLKPGEEESYLISSTGLFSIEKSRRLSKKERSLVREVVEEWRRKAKEKFGVELEIREEEGEFAFVFICGEVSERALNAIKFAYEGAIRDLKDKGIEVRDFIWK